jgi:hypothetical protein
MRGGNIRFMAAFRPVAPITYTGNYAGGSAANPFARGFAWIISWLMMVTHAFI